MNTQNRPQTLDSTRVAAQRRRRGPQAVELLKHYGIAQRGIARALEIDQKQVGRALHPDYFARMTHRRLHPIRQRVEAMLRAAGWEGDPAELWAEYDKHIDNHRAA